MWSLKLARGLARGRHRRFSSGVLLQKRISNTKLTQTSMPPVSIANH
jgi:hypothetical protein